MDVNANEALTSATSLNCEIIACISFGGVSLDPFGML